MSTWVQEYNRDTVGGLPVYTPGDFIRLDQLSRVQVKQAADQQGAPIAKWWVVAAPLGSTTLGVNLSDLFDTEAEAQRFAYLLVRPVLAV